VVRKNGGGEGNTVVALNDLSPLLLGDIGLRHCDGVLVRFRFYSELIVQR